MPSKNKKQSHNEARRWYRMDLHLHTPASADYREPNVTYFDFLKRAEDKGLDIVGFADHNTVAGYARYLQEVEELELLERLKRLTPEESKRLAEFRRLREKLLILPGFEFTATLGFHVLGMFPPDTPIRTIEHILLMLRVPPEHLDKGSTECGATADVITAYRVINEAGGIVIAAHANSSHGVAMPGFDFGGQTRIAYTQDPNLHALEVTDFASKSRRRTQMFFSGTKPEYPRRMHIVQSSDAHRLLGIPNNNQELGVGDRATEVLVDELSFEALKAVFLGNDFARTRPYVPSAKKAYDPISAAREEGETLVQAFHERLTKGKTIDRAILEDIVALANTNGGTIYIGASANARASVAGVERSNDAVTHLRGEIQKNIVPPLEVQIDVHKSEGKNILRVIVPRGSDVPYALDGSLIYLRSESETNLAVRDEIIQLVRESLAVEMAALAPEMVAAPTREAQKLPPESVAPVAQVEPVAPVLAVPPPHTGVEVIKHEMRKGTMYYSIRDLRNNHIVHNITRSSARKLWQYAISEFEDHPVEPAQVKWIDRVGLWKAHKRAGKMRYDLVQRAENKLYIYYGVTDDGIHGTWRALVESNAPLEATVEEVEETPTAEENVVAEQTGNVEESVELVEAAELQEVEEAPGEFAQESPLETAPPSDLMPTMTVEMTMPTEARELAHLETTEASAPDATMEITSPEDAMPEVKTEEPDASSDASAETANVSESDSPSSETESKPETTNY